jgi:acylphosphatase
MDETVLHLEVRGVVQGVGCRASMAREARRLGVRGWVRNRPDGSVEAVVAGSAEAIERIAARARRGPPASVVTAVDARPGEGRFVAFEQRPAG